MTTKNVIVFGKTGSGKSTLCNMLFAGHPKPDQGFEISDDAKAKTSKVDTKTGHGWQVTDTVGMGETSGVADMTKVAIEKLTDFLKDARDGGARRGGERKEYTYIIYVARKDRFSWEDACVWKAFTEIFKGGESNFVVVYTHTNQKWVQNNKQVFEHQYTGHNGKFIAVDFPDVDEEDDEEEVMRKKSVWEKNMKHLEETLTSYGLSPVQPEICSMDDKQLKERAEIIIHELIEVFKTLFASGKKLIGDSENIAAKAIRFFFKAVF